MKNKNVAALLAIAGGIFGIHRFYLGQVGLGILYSLLSFAMGFSIVLGILDGILFLMMDQETFDAKYNRRYAGSARRPRRRRDTDFERRPREQMRRERRPRPRPTTTPTQPRRRATNSRRTRRVKNNPFKQAGIKKFKEFDVEAAIEDFKQALKIDPNDLSIHFNLACAYSQTEQAELAYEHLSRAVEMGFNDYNRIDTHDALAYVRIQPQWESFKAGGYTLRKRLDAPKEDLLDNDLLLQQLKKLNELKDKGLITEEEFAEQRGKLIKKE